MVDILPIYLVGEDLGRRHQYLNDLVNSAFVQNVPLQLVLEQSENLSIDRIFKIDLASKYKHVEFIIHTLKDKDTLFVSRALKSKWLLSDEFSNIVNPEYLESHIYPDMTVKAVNKMRNWIELNLKDPQRCQVFYEYYKSDFDVAIKFLRHCPKEFIPEQVYDIMDKLTPKHLNMLCEACPQVAKVYFDGLQRNKCALKHFKNRQRDYFKSIMNVLKVEGDIYLDLIEKYFDKNVLKPLSPATTKYIMKNFKSRYLMKPELYAGLLLNMKTLASFLTSEEIKDIITRLARAQYLGFAFTYKIAEPLIKRLHGEERDSLKKKIFVDKSFGSNVDTWPYPPPEGLRSPEYDCELFEDVKHYPSEYLHLSDCNDNEMVGYSMCCKRSLKKRSGRDQYIKMERLPCRGNNSSLEALYNRYRFVNFDKVLFEFRKLLLTESTIEGRRNMILVLVSKAGANEGKMEQLLKLLVERHKNESENFRDAVARSLVKRGFVWRRSPTIWDVLLKWASTSVKEILHATVLRRLLENSPCSSAELENYLLNFSDFTEYSLNPTEKSLVAKRLPALLISANAPKLLLHTLRVYNLGVESVPGAIDIFIAAAREDKDMLQSLYQSRVGRRHLFKETFKIVQTDAAYMNALKHDVTVLEDGESFTVLISKEKVNHDRFLRALTVYFAEPNGLAARHLEALEKGINDKCHKSFARPLAFLLSIGSKSFKDYMLKTDKKCTEIGDRKFAAALRANAFVARPIIDIDEFDWHAIGSKLVSNKVMVCSDRDVNKYIQKCLTWKKTMRIGLRLAKRTDSVTEILDVIIKKRPTVALKVFISDMSKRKDRPVDVTLWNQIKAVILTLDLTKKTLIHVRRSLKKLNVMSDIEADYWAAVFEAFRKDSDVAAMPMLCRMENVLTEVDETALKNIIWDFLREKLNEDIMTKGDLPKECICLYFRVVAKYLILSKTDDEQKVKMETACVPFFEKIQNLRKELKDTSVLLECLDDFIISLKYSKAFLNSEYISCIPMFEKILEHLPKILPREKYFRKYVYIHVTMLYYRSIRQIMKQKPEIVENPKLMKEEGVEIVGCVLGRYIGIEIDDLVHRYFRSIVDIYQKGLWDFFTKFEYSQSRERLVKSVIRGLIENPGFSQLLARYLYSKEFAHKDCDEILKLLKEVNNEEMQFFLNADLYPH